MTKFIFFSSTNCELCRWCGLLGYHIMTHEGTLHIFWKKSSVDIIFFINFAFTETPPRCDITIMFSTNYQP